jgi:ubiquinone biosynthesis protein COQ4
MIASASVLRDESGIAKTDGRVRVGALDIAYDIRGSGEAILLIPGVTMRRIMWPDALADALAGRGFTVVRIDNRDAGDSSRVKARPPNVLALMRRSLLGQSVEVPYRLEDMAQDAFGLMRALGFEHFHVAGASMGGMIAQTMAILHPERLLSLISVMSGPGGRRYAFGKPAAVRALLSPVPKEREAHIERLVDSFRILGGGGLPFDEETARIVATAQVDGGTSPSAAARHFGAIIESSGRRRPLLRKVTTPTLVIHGSHDPLLPMRGAVATARHIRGAELVVIEGMGHDFPAPLHSTIADTIAAHARRAASMKSGTRRRLELNLPRAGAAFRGLLKDPDDLPKVFELVEALTTEAPIRRLRSQFRRTEAGRRLLRTRPDIVTILANRDRLRRMPDGSLGREYLAFVEREKISPEGIRKASEVAELLSPADVELAFIRHRMRDTHDLWHAVTGYGGDVRGEIGLLAFSLAQHWHPAIALIVVGGIVKSFGRVDVVGFVREAFARGRRAELLPAQDWESLLEQPVDRVRELLKVGAPPVYTPVRTEDLRAMGVVS